MDTEVSWQEVGQWPLVVTTDEGGRIGIYCSYDGEPLLQWPPIWDHTNFRPSKLIHAVQQHGTVCRKSPRLEGLPHDPDGWARKLGESHGVGS